MGLWIAPTACIAAMLAPFGLAGPVLRVMGHGIEQVLGVAHWVAGLPGAVQPVMAAPGAALGLLALGGLWLALWRGPWRFGGPVAVVAGLWLWANAPPRPDVLIAPDVRLVGVLGSEGRSLDHATAQGFAARTWLRRDGDAATQAEAASRPGLTRRRGRLSASINAGWRLEVFWSRKIRLGDLQRACRAKVVVIARYGPALDGPCRYFGKRALARGGALALSVRDGALVVRHARDPAKRRLWGARSRKRR
jgi:competence protein ComEC